MGLKLVGVLLLLGGAVYPMWGIVDLVRWTNRQQVPFQNPLPLMVRMVLIATVPLAGILGGLAFFLPAVWASEILRLIILATGSLSVLGLLLLALLGRVGLG